MDSIVDLGLLSQDATSLHRAMDTVVVQRRIAPVCCDIKFK